MKIAVIDRFEGTGRRSLGLNKGYGLRQGAIAISSGFDEGNAVVIGCNDRDMSFAVNRLQLNSLIFSLREAGCWLKILF